MSPSFYANALVIFKFRNRVFSDRSFSNNFIYKAGPNYFETHELRFSANLSARSSDAALSLACSADVEQQAALYEPYVLR